MLAAARRGRRRRLRRRVDVRPLRRARSSGARWSRDPFVTLGAIAAVTERIGLGVLVANVANRHPGAARLGVNTLQSLAPGRVWCGVGVGHGRSQPVRRRAARDRAQPGAAAGSPRAPARDDRLPARDLARPVRTGATWLRADPAIGVVDDAPIPPIIVGGGSEAIVRLAAARRRRRQPASTARSSARSSAWPAS